MLDICDYIGIFLDYGKYGGGGVYKRSLSLLIEMVFYSWLILIIVAATGNVPLTGDLVVEGLFPMLRGNWYAVYYLIFSLFVPFINVALRNIDKRNYMRLLVVVFVLWSLVQTITFSSFFSNFDFFLVMYLVGAFIRLHTDKLQYPNRWNLYTALISGILLMLTVPFMDYVGVITGNDRFISSATHFKDFACPIGVVFAISMFLYFKNKTFYSKAINRIAASTLAIYLIHDNSMMRTLIWTVIFPNADYLNSPWLIVHVIVKCSCVFIICLAIDQIRLLTVGKLTKRWLDSRFPVWQEKYARLEEKIFSKYIRD